VTATQRAGDLGGPDELEIWPYHDEKGRLVGVSIRMPPHQHAAVPAARRDEHFRRAHSAAADRRRRGAVARRADRAPKAPAGFVSKGADPNHRFGRVAMASRMILRMRSRSSPTSGSRGGRHSSVPYPHSADASLMYCTNFTCVSRCRSGVYQR
jgi:hypothetical protein